MKRDYPVDALTRCSDDAQLNAALAQYDYALRVQHARRLQARHTRRMLLWSAVITAVMILAALVLR